MDFTVIIKYRNRYDTCCGRWLVIFLRRCQRYEFLMKFSHSVVLHIGGSWNQWRKSSDAWFKIVFIFYGKLRFIYFGGVIKMFTCTVVMKS